MANITKNEMISMRKNGATYREIANAAGVSAGRVRQILSASGLVEHRSKKQNENFTAVLVKMHNDGMKYCEIAKEVGMDATLVRQRIVREEQKNEKLMQKRKALLGMEETLKDFDNQLETINKAMNNILATLVKGANNGLISQQEVNRIKSGLKNI